MKKILLMSAFAACCVHSQQILTPEQAGERYNAPGYAYGEDHCYGFAAPEGWYMDNAMARKLGVGMVFLPEGADWNNAKLAMYTRVFSLDGMDDGDRLIAAALDSVETMYRGHGIEMQRERLDSLQSESGEQGELWQLNLSAQSGMREYVAYFPAGGTLSVFVIQIDGSGYLTQAQHAIRELARSYHRRSICEPCGENRDSCQ